MVNSVIPPLKSNCSFMGYLLSLIYLTAGEIPKARLQSH